MPVATDMIQSKLGVDCEIPVSKSGECGGSGAREFHQSIDLDLKILILSSVLHLG